ncbi:hypothetical protein [Lysobacter sp. cf310]|uniref:hypothetical protein n=1 Tax=Lysobacter sp. cf310 TaxID=1761790 RepID=UPI000B87AD95|nr:hypothetical protein [Lysobacter sp. cf310]
MTIRELLKAKLFKARVVGFGCWLLCVGVIFLDVPERYKAWVLIPTLGFVGAVLYMFYCVRCPKCGARIGQAMMGMRKSNFCPSCGVGLDTRA